MVQVDFDRRELAYMRYVINQRLSRTTRDYERNKRMFEERFGENCEKFSNMEAEIMVLTAALDKITLGIADCNIESGLE